MSRLLLGGLLVLATWAVAGSADCSPYGHPRSSGCRDYERQSDDVPFFNLNTLLHDATSQERLAPFVLNVTLGIYKFLHPCATNAEAILRLFYDHRGDVPTDHSQWWHDMAHMIGEHLMVGRRKRQDQGFDSETELLYSQLRNIVQDDGNADCVQWLMYTYKGAAEREFKRQHPNFRPPTPPPPTTTPPPTTPTTTPPPTTLITTPTPTTTPTTPTPTTTPTTTPEPTTTPTTTTPMSTTTPVTRAKCTVCSGLQCLLSAHVEECGALQGFCLTNVEDTASGRQISRQCADQQTCDNITNDPECAGIETSVLSDGIQCDYCCTGQDNCNTPPQLLPDNLYTPQP